MTRFNRLLKANNLKETFTLIDVEPIAANWKAKDFPQVLESISQIILIECWKFF